MALTVWTRMLSLLSLPSRPLRLPRFSALSSCTEIDAPKVRLPFFFLWYGRSRSKARSLHEKKLLLRKLLHGHRWSHAAWQIIKTKTQTTKNTRQDADPPARFASHHQKDSKANSERGKSPTETTTKICQDTVVKTHCVAIDSKTCSKRISCHPERRDTRSTLLPRRQQKVAIAIHCHLTQSLRVLSRVLVHVPKFRL